MNNTLHLAVLTLLLAVSSLSAATLYVSPGSTNPTPPYTNWATAATDIQQAVGAAAAGDAVVVTNGVYAGGVAVTNPLTLRSVNGPQLTVINGGGTTQCVFLTNGASMTGFNLTNGYRFGVGGGGVGCASVNAYLTNCLIIGNWAENGGGVYGGTLYNCTLSGNSAQTNTFYMDGVGGGADNSVLYNCTLSGNLAKSGGGAAYCTLHNCTLSGNSAVVVLGGGVFGGTLYNCTLTGNSALGVGGGAYGATLYNCTLTANSAGGGGGAFGGPSPCTLYNCTVTGNTGGGVVGSTLYNCIVYSNTASGGGANYDPYGYSTLNYCCTTPRPTNGVGNITSTPLFVDYANGNLRLLSNSPCINAGNNSSLTNYALNPGDGTLVWFTNLFDLDGRPRLVGGTVDMGAYEFQPGASGAFIGWLQGYGLPTDGSADFADTDAGSMNNWQEWVCGTDPTNRLSALRLISAAPAGANVTVSWQSVAGVDYFLERSANLAAPFTFVATNILGQASTTTTTYADTNATDAGPFFYRVGVKSP